VLLGNITFLYLFQCATHYATGNMYIICSCLHLCV